MTEKKMPLWLGNKVSGKYSMTYPEIIQKFKQHKSYDLWNQGYKKIEVALAEFITDHVEDNGLNSTFEKEDLFKLADFFIDSGDWSKKEV